jgi:octaprenyl-diphosphate synthase
VIRSKTAKLFEASARLGAVLAGARRRSRRPAPDYGQALGTAFQVIDDVLDYDGDARGDGQEPGRRPARRQGHPAPDRRHARGSPAQRDLIRHAIETARSTNSIHHPHRARNGRAGRGAIGRRGRGAARDVSAGTAAANSHSEALVQLAASTAAASQLSQFSGAIEANRGVA